MGCTPAPRPARRKRRTRTHSTAGSDPMSWLRSRKNVQGLKGTVKRWLRNGGLALAGVLLFGVVVSLVGFLQVPAVPLTALPDSAAPVTEMTGLYPITMGRV